jgi:hypothetical protein
MYEDISRRAWPKRKLTWNNGKNYPIIGIHFPILCNINQNPQRVIRCLFWLCKQPELPFLPIELVHLIASWYVLSM